MCLFLFKVNLFAQQMDVLIPQQLKVNIRFSPFYQAFSAMDRRG